MAQEEIREMMASDKMSSSVSIKRKLGRTEMQTKSPKPVNKREI